MKKLIYGLFLVLALVGCQFQTAPTGEVTYEEPQEVVKNEVIEKPIEEPEPKTEEIIILGRNGFNPELLTINQGTTVEWLNFDAEENVIVLVFQKDDNRNFINSNHIPPGGSYKSTFDETGTYNYWSLAYGVSAKIIVE